MFRPSASTDKACEIYSFRCWLSFHCTATGILAYFLVTLKLFLNAKSSLSLWSKLAFGHRKWFLNTNLFRIKTFLITKFDCIRISKAYMWLCSGMEWSLTAKLVNVKSFICATESPQNFQKIEGLLKYFFFRINHGKAWQQKYSKRSDYAWF